MEKWNKLIFTTAVCLMMSPVFAKHQGNTTPTQYLITISQVSFHRVGDPANTFISYATGTGQYDIASVSPNANVGVLKATGTLPQGTYDEVQFTVSKSMTLTASSSALSDGSPCRTDSASTVITNPFHDGSIDKGYLGNRDGGTAKPEVVSVPKGSRVKLNSGITDEGSTFQGVIPVNFTVTSSTPTITLKFDVTNGASLFPNPLDATQCFVFPDAPSVTITAT